MLSVKNIKSSTLLIPVIKLAGLKFNVVLKPRPSSILIM